MSYMLEKHSHITVHGSSESGWASQPPHPSTSAHSSWDAQQRKDSDTSPQYGPPSAVAHCEVHSPSVIGHPGADPPPHSSSRAHASSHVARQSVGKSARSPRSQKPPPSGPASASASVSVSVPASVPASAPAEPPPSSQPAVASRIKGAATSPSH